MIFRTVRDEMDFGYEFTLEDAYNKWWPHIKNKTVRNRLAELSSPCVCVDGIRIDIETPTSHGLIRRTQKRGIYVKGAIQCMTQIEIDMLTSQNVGGYRPQQSDRRPPASSRQRRKNLNIDKRSLYNAQQGCCALCGISLPRLRDFVEDHIFPLGAGGEDARENIQLVCWSCNHWKSDKPFPVNRLWEILEQNREMIGPLLARQAHDAAIEFSSRHL